MARGSQTHQKRQRENKVREKAQLKRELRQQRQADKKRTLELDGQPSVEQFDSAEPGDGNELSLEMPLTDEVGVEPGDPDQGLPAWQPAQDISEPRMPRGGALTTKLFVGNLPHSVTDNELADFATSAGCAVASVQVIRDRITGDPKGFGFVALAEGTTLQDAIGMLDGQMLQGRRLTVNEARPQRPGASGSRGGFGSGGRGYSGFGRMRDR